MSMLSFPQNGAELTRDEALTMIIASIAMEELALSHILNAEGEKLQYILGALPDSRKHCAGTEEVLAVNESVTGLLNAVAQNQMLLKNKLERALEASEERLRDHSRSAMELTAQWDGYLWDSGSAMPWRCRGRQGDAIQWSEATPTLVRLSAKRAYVVSYVLHVFGALPGREAGLLRLKQTPGGVFTDTLPLRFSLMCPEEPTTLQYMTLLFPQAQTAAQAAISLVLNGKGPLCVHQASLSIVEL